jgi:hypothetical protein
MKEQKHFNLYKEIFINARLDSKWLSSESVHFWPAAWLPHVKKIFADPLNYGRNRVKFWKSSIVLLSYSTIDLFFMKHLFIFLFGSYFKVTILLKNEKNLKFIQIGKKFHNVFHNIKDKSQRKTDFSSKIKLFFENI